MTNLFFGLFIIFFTVPFWMAFISSGNFFVLIFIAIFDVIGVWLFYKGLTKFIRDSKTKKNGVETYAQIMRVSPTGTYVNGVPELKGEFMVFNPDTYQTDTVEEILGVGAFKYHEGQVVKVKYYDGDINIISIADLSEVPGDISKFFSTSNNAPGIVAQTFSNITNPADEIEIDGVKYKKVD